MISKFRIGQKVGCRFDIFTEQGKLLMKKDQVFTVRDIKLTSCCKDRVFIINVGDFGIFMLECEKCGATQQSPAYLYEGLFYPIQEQDFGSMVLENVKKEIVKEYEYIETEF